MVQNVHNRARGASECEVSRCSDTCMRFVGRIFDKFHTCYGTGQRRTLTVLLNQPLQLPPWRQLLLTHTFYGARKIVCKRCVRSGNNREFPSHFLSSHLVSGV